MPGFTGLETLRELKNSSFAAHVPVIIHTSKDLNQEELEVIKRFGASLYPKQKLAEADSSASLRMALAGAGVL